MLPILLASVLLLQQFVLELLSSLAMWLLTWHDKWNVKEIYFTVHLGSSLLKMFGKSKKTKNKKEGMSLPQPSVYYIHNRPIWFLHYLSESTGKNVKIPASCQRWHLTRHGSVPSRSVYLNSCQSQRGVEESFQCRPLFFFKSGKFWQNPPMLHSCCS